MAEGIEQIEIPPGETRRIGDRWVENGGEHPLIVRMDGGALYAEFLGGERAQPVHYGNYPDALVADSQEPSDG